MTIPRFQKAILDWYKRHKRSLAWRNTKDPYKILVSEVMLQQTQISRALPKYQEFLKAFPNLQSLARAANKKLLKVWAGLGYWKRALFLKETAKRMLKGKFPKDPEILQAFPGIGPYTARAVACFAFQNRDAFLDTNIRRVYLHFFFPKKKNVSDKEILKIAQKAVWKKNPRTWHYALLDYGAGALKDRSINKRSKQYARQNRFEGSFRSFRTKVVHFLLGQPNQTATNNKLRKLLRGARSPYSLKKILSSLEKDGLIKKKGRSYSL